MIREHLDLLLFIYLFIYLYIFIYLFIYTYLYYIFTRAWNWALEIWRETPKDGTAEDFLVLASNIKIVAHPPRMWE